MPFEKGKATPGAGRKGYSYEQKEVDRMKKILGKYFSLMEKPKLTFEERERFNRLEKAALKIMDKRHASKSDVKIDIPKPILIKNG